MKRSKRLIIALVALVVIAGATVAVSQYEQEKEAISASGEVVLEISTADVRSLSWQYEDNDLSFHYDSGWVYDGDEAFDLFVELMRLSYEDKHLELMTWADNMSSMGREEQNLAADNTTPVRDLLFEALGNASVLMGHFSPKGISLCPSTLALHKKAREEARDLLVRDADREEIVKRLCQPASPIRTATRLEGGRALLLERHLARLIRLASEHAIPTDRLESLARAVSSVELPLPGSEALWSGGLPCPWGMLPASVEEELLKAGVDIQKRAALHMELQKDGSVLFAALPLAEDGTRTCGVCRTCLDERSDAWQLDTTKALQEQDTIQERVQAGEIDDAIIVNRCAAVAGTGHGALLCKQGPALFCPPARERARDSVCLDFLLERSLVQERLCGLAKALSSQELFRANSLHGLEKLVVVKD